MALVLRGRQIEHTREFS